MIIWLASYPKSGNTFLRALLTSYFFSKDGIFEFDKLKSIKFFPHINLFKNLGIDITNENEVLKNYIKVQKNINERYKNSLFFLKTHSTMQTINGFSFTDYKNTLGAIYIVRDPRNVASSYANHYNTSVEQSVKDMISKTYLKGMKDYQDFEENVLTHLGTWSDNYNSWKKQKKSNKYLLIKYEDLVTDTNEVFHNVLQFIGNLMNKNIKIDYNKFDNAIKTTSFENLQKLEKENGFIESIKYNQNDNVTFFKKGIQRDWKDSLPEKLIQELEMNFSKEMKEIGYL